jgi:hypothetical protein
MPLRRFDFFENLWRYVHHRYQRHRWQICHWCQGHRRKIVAGINNISITFASVYDTGGIFAIGVNDTGGKLQPVSTTPAANLPPVSTSPGANNGTNYQTDDNLK